MKLSQITRNESLAAAALAMACYWTFALSASGALHYVDANSTNATPPYTNWAIAASSIQAAVDAALPGDEVVVSNGIYATGGRAVYGAMTNRVVVDRPIMLRSVNGPEVTVIKGRQVPIATGLPPINTGSIRCLYLTNGAVANGFTLTNGATTFSGDSITEQSGGGVFCSSTAALLTNCVITGNAAASGGGAYSGTLVQCKLQRNAVVYAGGGILSGNLRSCILTGNYAGNGSWIGDGFGGGAKSCTLSNCTLAGNNAYVSGGGASSCTIIGCTFTGNASAFGGGASSSTLNNCTLTGNGTAIRYSEGFTYGGSGGGAYSSQLTNCVLANNRGLLGGGTHSCTVSTSILTSNSVSDICYGCAVPAGGGANSGTLINCTITGNSATDGGGAYAATLNNCILFFNSATNGPNFSGGTFNYCCVTPMPTNGLNNFTNPPLFVDYAGGNLRLQSNSPCINAGLNSYCSESTDLDGRPRIVGGTVDLGAYEYQGAGMGEFIGWLQQYHLPTDGSADAVDSDADSLSNWQEWRCLTDPTNALSVLRVVSATRNGADVQVNWTSVAGVNYFLERATDLSAVPSFTRLATSLTGQSGTTTFTDTNASSATQLFYRIGVP